MARLPGEVDRRRFLRAMARFGWKVESQRGSHRKLVHPERRDFLIIAFHRNLGRNTVRRILRQAGIDEEEFIPCELICPMQIPEGVIERKVGLVRCTAEPSFRGSMMN